MADATKTPEQRIATFLDIKDDQQSRDYYNKWAKHYDQDLSQLNYGAPDFSADLLKKLLPTEAASVLDAGCGTGWSGKSLSERGYQTIDGIDYAPGMLEVAKTRGLYRLLDQADLSKPLAKYNAPYDGIVAVGTLTFDFLGTEQVDHLLPLLRSGGAFVLCTNITAWTKRKCDAYFTGLQSKGIVKDLIIKTVEYMPGHHASGMITGFIKV